MTAATSTAFASTTKATSRPLKPSPAARRRDPGTKLPLAPVAAVSVEAEAMPQAQEKRSPAYRRWFRETRLAIMEEHLASLEKAALVLISSLERQRDLLESLKANEGFDFEVHAPTALFGDAVLFREYEAKLVKLETPNEPVFEDAVFDAIEKHRAAYDAYQAAYDGNAPDREKTDEALDSAFEDLVRFKPHSEVGALALAAYLREYARRTGNWDTSGTIGRVLDVATAAAAHVLPRTKQTAALKG